MKSRLKLAGGTDADAPGLEKFGLLVVEINDRERTSAITCASYWQHARIDKHTRGYLAGRLHRVTKEFDEI